MFFSFCYYLLVARVALVPRLVEDEVLDVLGDGGLVVVADGDLEPLCQELDVVHVHVFDAVQGLVARGGGVVGAGLDVFVLELDGRRVEEGALVGGRLGLERHTWAGSCC